MSISYALRVAIAATHKPKVRQILRQKLMFRLALWLPRDLALMAFIRVYAASDPEASGPYREMCENWERGAGK